MYRLVLFFLLFLNIEAFPQWKSHYPEGENKKQDLKEKQEKDGYLYETYFFNALKEKSLENYKEALSDFQKCIKINNKKPVPYYESAVLNKHQGNLDLAEEQIKKAVSLEPNNRWYILAYAQILFAKQDFKNAALQYKKLISIEPGNEELYYFLAETHIYNNAFLKAINVYDELEKSKGLDKRLCMQKYKLYMQLQKKKSAIKELLKIIKTHPNDIEALEILSETYLLNDEKEKAFEVFKKISIVSPNNGRIHLTLADYYREKNENQKSFRELKLAFKSKSLGVDIKVKILASYFQLVTHNEIMRRQADTLANILISIHQGNPKAHAVYADVLYASSRFEEAKKHYLKTLEKDKTNALVWSQILFIQAEKSDFSGMLNTSKEALTYFPSNPFFYYFNGLSNKRFENNQEAVDVLETGVQFVVENNTLLTEFYSLLAGIYHDLENHQLSDSLYERVLVINPDNVVVLNNYAYYLSLRKIKLEKAKKMSLKCNNLEKDNGTYQDTYAWILYQLGEYEKAEKWMLRALENGGKESAVVVEHYGDILYKKGDKKAAVFQWKKAQKIGEGSSFLFQKIKEETLYE